MKTPPNDPDSPTATDASADAGAAGAGFSPLLMVADEPEIHSFMQRLDRVRQELKAVEEAQSTPDKPYELIFERSELRAVNAAFGRAILSGESALHKLCELLVDELFDGDVALQSKVIGEIGETGDRFTLTEGLDPKAIYTQTDLQLGLRMLDPLRFLRDGHELRARLISNSVEYQPLETNDLQIHRMISRIKAEEELWSKVCDELFQLDQIVARDKELRSMSRFVKDVFGIKIIVESELAAHRLLDRLREVAWVPEHLEHRGVSTDTSFQNLSELETKDYIAQSKHSGWNALKSVFQWGGKTIEVQIQPINTYYRELLYLTRESHAGHKERRERLRAQVGEKMPLFAFYSKLLKWLFIEPAGEPPTHPNVQLILKGT